MAEGRRPKDQTDPKKCSSSGETTFSTQMILVLAKEEVWNKNFTSSDPHDGIQGKYVLT